MYTTLATLKEVKACIPGYTRMVSFFGTRAEMKDVRIPLFMLPIVGQTDDCTWAIQHGAVIDPTDYGKFRARNLAWVVRRLFSRVYSNNTGREGHMGTPPTPVRQAIIEYFAARSDDEVCAWYAKWSAHSYEHWLWEELFRSELMNVPSRFVYYALDEIDAVLHDDMKFALLRRDYVGIDPCSFVSRNSRDDDDDDDDGCDEDEPRRRGPYRKVPAKKISAKVEDVDSAADLQRIRRNEVDNLSGMQLNMKFKELGWSVYACPFRDSSQGDGANMARLLCNGEDPYQKAIEFIAEHDLAKKAGVKGFMLSKANDKEPPGYHMTVNLTDPRSIFAMFHMMKAKELKVADMFGVPAVINQVDNLLRESGNLLSGRSAAALSQFEVETTDFGDLTLSRVDELDI